MPSAPAAIHLADGLSREYLIHHRVCPRAFTAEGTLVVATAPDAQLDALDDIAYAYRCTVQAEPATNDELDRLIERVTTRAGREIELARVDGGDEDLTSDVRDLANQPPVVRYVNLLVRDAYDASACSSYANSPGCTETAETCVDASPATRTVNGLNVTERCWKLERDYACASPSYTNYCTPLTGAGCTEAAPPVCAATAPNGTCLENTRTYTCGASQPANPTVVLLNASYTVVTDGQDLSACLSYTSNPNCVLAASVCTDSAPATRMVDGFPITKRCWAWSNSYACVSGTPKSNCGDFQNDPHCALASRSCVDAMDANAPVPGGCDIWESTYKCQTRPSTTSTVADCGSQSFCLDGSCFDAGYSPDQDIGKAAASLEAGREMGVYEDPTTHRLFAGAAKDCRNTFGNCCKSTGGASSLSNQALMSTAMSAVKFGAESVVKWGSSYVFDYLKDSALSAMLGQMGLLDSMTSWASSATSLNLYGLQFSFGANGVAFVGFDPYSFAIAAAFMIVSSLTSCTQDEQMLAMSRGQGLCSYVGSYCGSKALGLCVKHLNAYCCFNSKLARIINEQGRPQLGLAWGSPQHPDCSGFTIAQIQSLDFSKIDLSEFISDVVVKAKSDAYGVSRALTKVPTAPATLNGKYVTPH